MIRKVSVPCFCLLCLFAAVLCGGTQKADARTFVHPSSMVSMNEINTMKAHIQAGDEPFTSQWRRLQSIAQAKSTYTTSGSAEIGGSDGTRQRVSSDATAAFYNALEWQITGTVAYANCAARILTVYANTIKTSAAQLYQYPARDLCFAAEMLRNADGSFYSGWGQAARDTFLAKVRGILVPALRSQRTNGMCSWSAGAIDGLLIAGVLLDDESIYNEAVGYFKSPSIPGSVMGLMLSSGQLKEMGRDMVHANLGLDDLCKMAHVAWTQGDDLFGYDNNRLLRGFDYWCEANLGYDNEMTYTPVGKWYYLSTHNNSNRLCPDGSNFECAFHHYKEVAKLPETDYPYLARYTRLARPATFYHTLFYISSIDAAPLLNVVPDKPSGFAAQAALGHICLSWQHPRNDDARGFRVYRSDDGLNFSCIKTWDNYTKPLYLDESATVGKRYFYRVGLINYAGESELSDVSQAAAADSGSAVLPVGWAFSSVNTAVAGSGRFSSSQEGTFAVAGGGKDIGGTADSHGFVGMQVRGDATFTVRLTSTDESFYKVGILMRGTLGGNSQRVGITLGETGCRLCRMCVRYSNGGSTTWTEGDDFTYAPVWFRLVRRGNVFTAYQGRDGNKWYLIGTATVAMPVSYYVGLASCTGSDTGNAYQAVFDHVTLQNTATTPAAPTGLKAQALNGGRAALSWTAAGGAVEYVVNRLSPVPASFVVADTAFQDSCLQANTAYAYSVHSKGIGGLSGDSAVASVTTPVRAVPAAPKGLRAIWMGSGKALVTWNFTDEATSFVLCRATSPDGEYETVLTDSVFRFADVSLTSGKTYYYKVFAANELGTGTAGGPASVTVYDASKITGTVIGTSGSWNNVSSATKTAAVDGNLGTYFDSTQGSGAYVGYDLGRNGRAALTQIKFAPRSNLPARMVGGKFQLANRADFGDAVTPFEIGDTPAVGSLTAKDVVSGVATYRYLRYLSPDDGFCNVAEVQFYGHVFTLQNQVITFPALEEKAVGTADSAPGASATSGLPVTYTTSDAKVATIVDGLIHAVSEGTCTIFADQPGNDVWGTALQVAQTLRVVASTGIPAVPAASQQILSTRCYTIDGKAISGPASGIYIQGGKKYLQRR
jgi:regulation of enolase protein 1 (concanavalin A-like superfamily)